MSVKNLRERKTELRTKIKKRRKNFDTNKKSELDNIIFKKLIKLDEYKNASVILTYISKELEVDTFKLIEFSLNNGKSVAVPKCIDGTREMEFYIIKSIEDTKTASFGILEPKTHKCTKLLDFSGSLCIVPGFSFDTNGYRIGYGKGYYDRFLSKYNGNTIGICYSKDFKWHLPHGYYDKPVDTVITDSFIRTIKSYAQTERTDSHER